MKYFLIAILFFIQLSVSAQNRQARGEFGGDVNSGFSGQENDPSDTTKKTKERLITGRISGDTIPSFIESWIFQDELLNNKSVEVDTFITDFHVFDKLFKNNLSASRLSNIALPYKSHHFFNFNDKNEYFFENYLSDYLFTNEKAAFYSTNLPFTSIFHSASTKQVNEQSLELIHTQNISTKWNVGFRYDVTNAKGQMTNNTSIINSGVVWTSYFSPKYNLQTNFVMNKVIIEQNGGINDEFFVANAEIDPVKLSVANTKLANWSLMLHQKYKIGFNKVKKDSILTAQKTDSVVFDTIFVPLMSFNHTLKLKHASRVYNDEKDMTSDFYPSYQQATFTYDSTFYSLLENTFQVQFNENQQAKFKFRARAFIKNQIIKQASSWGGSLPEGSILHPNFLSRPTSFDYVNTSIGGALFDFSAKKWDWFAAGELYTIGRKSGDILLNGSLERIFITKNDSIVVSLSGNYSQSTPFYRYEYFYSNHYNWQNQFKKEGRLNGNFEVKFKKYKLYARLQIANLENYIYFGKEATPVQNTQNMQVISIDLNKTFEFGKFFWSNAINYQLISDKTILQIPDFIYKTQLFGSFILFKKALKLETGVEMEFTSAYQLPAYNPALGIFYQNSVPHPSVLGNEGGNFPMFSFYANFKVKKVLAFINFRNLNTLLDFSHTYTTYSYPTEKMTFHWGVLWRFYD